MKISVTCCDVSSNAFGRAYILAKMLASDFEVEIVGPAMGDGVWKPLCDPLDVPCRYVPLRRDRRTSHHLREIMDLMDGDVLYASKPLYHSYVLALRARRGRSVVLDIDDWEWGCVRAVLARKPAPTRVTNLVSSVFSIHRKHGPTGAWLGERLATRANAITVSSRFLQEKFGGLLIPHGRDEHVFDPARFDQAALKQAQGIGPEQKVVMFLGTPRAHKGIDDLIDSMRVVGDADSVLVIAGIDTSQALGQEIAERAERALGARFRAIGQHPFSEAPQILAMADVVVVPQQVSPASIGQMPAKLYDAMAMGKPVVATAVSDIPEVLEGCGWIAQPGDSQDLARQISAALADGEEAQRRGRLARTRFLERYSWSAIRPTLSDLFARQPAPGGQRPSP